MHQDTSGRFVAYDLVNGTMLGVLALRSIKDTSTTRDGGNELRRPFSRSNSADDAGRGLVGTSAGFTWAGGGDYVAVAVPPNDQVSTWVEEGGLEGVVFHCPDRLAPVSCRLFCSASLRAQL